MQKHFTYQVSLEQQKQSGRQFFWASINQSLLIGLIGFLILLAAITWVVSPANASFMSLMAASPLLILAAVLRRYDHLAIKSFALMEHPTIDLTLDDEMIVYRNSVVSKHFSWDKIERVIETQDFLVLMNGHLPLLNLPKTALDADTLSRFRNITRPSH